MSNETLAQHFDSAGDGETVNYDAIELGLEDLGYVNLIDYCLSEDGTRALIAVSCTEPLEFHRGIAPEYFNEDGSLTESAYKALDRIFAHRYSATLHFADDEVLSFTVELSAPADMPEIELSQQCWEGLVKLYNELDPGTFGAQYLFGTIIADAIREAS